MKVLIIAHGYPTIQDPQWGCFEKDQALAFQCLGHDVSIMYIDGRFRKEKRKIGISHIKADGINIYGIFWFPFALIKKLGIKYELKLRSKMLCSLYKVMEKMEGKPDIIYSHYLYNTASAVVLKEKYNIPLIGIEHWSLLNQSTISNDVRYAGKIAYFKADKLLSVSKTLSESIDRHFGQKTIVVNNMVSNEFLIKSNLKKINNNSCFQFVAIGSLLPIKGYDILIDAFHKAELSKNKCKLIIVGGGSENIHLQNQITSLSLTDSISLVGRKNKQEIISILNESNAFVLSSHSETFSVVCIEAMALGLPIVATRCGGPEEFITEEIGLLVKSGSVDALAEAMNEMYNNYHNYDRENIRNICKCKFAPEVIAKQLSSIFEEVVNKHQSQK